MTSVVYAVYRCVHDNRTRDKEWSNATRKGCVVDVDFPAPPVGSIKAPDTTVGAALSFHSGAIAYYTGDQTNLLEQRETSIYLGALLVSIIGSGMAWIMSPWRRALSQDQERLLRLLAIVQDVPTADLDTLEALGKEVEAMHARAVERRRA